jgi:MFS family permease
MKIFSNHDLKNSIYDGMCASVFATLTAGVFLTGFALHLGMDEFSIGILAAIPYAATLFQLQGSYLIAKNGRRKRLAVLSAAIARSMWLIVLGIAFLPLASLWLKHVLLLSLIFLSHCFISISYVSWLSWTSELVPEGSLGNFFGTRNMLNGTAGIAAVIAFGYFLDFTQRNLPDASLEGFGLIFVAAVLFGLLSCVFLMRISDPQKAPPPESDFKKNLLLPLKDTNFLRFLIYTFFWNLAVYAAGPFVTLYMLRELAFSYGFVAILAMTSAIADLTAMKFWGVVSDRFKNKAIIHAASWVAVFLPLLWSLVRPGSLWMPVILHILGGTFWAGIQLCTNNLVLRISPRQHRPLYISAYNITAGVGATVAPVLAGLAVKTLSAADLSFLPAGVLPLHLVFLASTILRLGSLQLVRKFHEPQEVSIGQLIRILRNVRGLNTTNGFHPVLHPFVPVNQGEAKLKPQPDAPAKSLTCKKN